VDDRLFDPDPEKPRRELPRPDRPVDGKVGKDHPDTSKQAARFVRYAVGTQKAQLLDYVRDGGPDGVTCAEVAGLIGISRNQCATRMGELRDDGWVEPKLGLQGEPVTRVATITSKGETRGVVHVLTIEARIKMGVRWPRR
jgi:hypothetical protein